MERKAKESPIEPTYLEMVCFECHAALMYEHPTNPLYLKCCSCGACKLNPKPEKSGIILMPELRDNLDDGEKSE